MFTETLQIKEIRVKYVYEVSSVLTLILSML